MNENTHYTRSEIIIATRCEWITRGGAFRFGADHPVVVAHADALAGLQRTGGVKVDSIDYPTGAKVSNRIRRMIDPAYDPTATDDRGNAFGSIHPATVIVPADLFHTFDVWGRGPGHIVTAEALRPKVTQALRRIVARLPERGYRPGVAGTVTDGMADTVAGVAFTAYRMV